MNRRWLIAFRGTNPQIQTTAQGAARKIVDLADRGQQMTPALASSYRRRLVALIGEHQDEGHVAVRPAQMALDALDAHMGDGWRASAGVG